MNRTFGGVSLFVILLVIAGFTSSYKSCVSASEQEGRYSQQVQTKAQQWANQNTVLAVNPMTIVCTPRSFGNRWPDDYHYCTAISNVQIPGRGLVPLHLLCNIQGCTINPIENNNR